jgi:tetratricopeptide (TPR) repeat protein
MLIMDDTAFVRLAEIFEHARLLDLKERSVYLEQACVHDPKLMAQVMTLLAQHDREGLLDDPIKVTASPNDPMPERVGQYRIIGTLGRGGMGTVYRAEQENPRREVAIKMVHAGLLSPELSRRFEFESSVLARLQHPGIAKIFEVGTWDDGRGARPFFAMELAEGVTLDRYIEQERPTTEQCLSLFMAICDAVNHAHQKGVIHRDLKPSNILVTPDGAPKVLDFGIARTTDADVLATQQTAIGQLIGTLAYMSPEQINSAVDDLDTRSDVYALGVIMYELLTGKLPYAINKGSIAGAARIIEEAQPRSLTTYCRALSGDLNTITLKALRKEPNDRYQSASDLAADVGRFLGHEPISARPATVLYKTRMFARRHRGLVAGIFGIFTVLVLGVTGIVWQAARVSAESRTRQEVSSFLREMLTSVDPAKTAGVPLTVRSMLDDAAASLPDRFSAFPLVRGELHDTVGMTYHRLGDFDSAEEHLRLAIADYANQIGPSADETIKLEASLAETLRQLGRLEEAEMLLLDCVSRVQLTDGPASTHVRLNLASVLVDLGRFDEAEALYRLIYTQTQSNLGPDAEDTLLAQNNLGVILMNQGDHDEALPLLESCFSRRRASLGDDHPLTISTLASVAALYGNMGREDEAVPMLYEAAVQSERVLGPVHLSTIRRRHNVIVMSLRKGDFAEATIQARTLLEVIDTKLDPWHAERLGAVEILVTSIALAGDTDEGEALALESYRVVEANRGPKHRSTGRAAMLLYNLYEEMGDTVLMDLWLERVEASDFTPPGTP